MCTRPYFKNPYSICGRSANVASNDDEGGTNEDIRGSDEERQILEFFYVFLELDRVCANSYP